MGYVGNQTTNSFSSQPSKQDFTGSSGSSITLSHAVASPEDISLYINHVRQEPTTSYTVAGTTVSFVGYSISATDDVYVTYNALALQTVVPTDDSVTNDKIDTMAASKLTGTIDGLRFPSGSIIQVQYTQYTGTTTTACTNFTDIALSHLAVNITPKSTSSIIKIEAMVNGEWSNTVSPYNGVWFFLRNNVKLAASNAGNRNRGILMSTLISFPSQDVLSTPEAAIYSYFDAPSTTSQVTYTVGVNQGAGASADWYTNRTGSDTDTGDYERGISLISATEIAG